jgi:hypothetical protein
VKTEHGFSNPIQRILDTTEIHRNSVMQDHSLTDTAISLNDNSTGKTIG